MDKKALTAKLNAMEKPALVEFLARLYLDDLEVQERIERFVNKDDVSRLIHNIKNRIQGFMEDTDYIHYKKSHDYAQKLSVLLDDIEQYVLPVAPQPAYLLADYFIAAADDIIANVDDSGGLMREVYDKAALLWLDAAADTGRDDNDWVEQVYKRYHENDHGLLDTLLPSAGRLLNRQQLATLAERFKDDAQEAEKTHCAGQRYCWPLHQALIGLGQVAMAMEDPELYEQSVTWANPEPNDLQKANIASVFLQFKHPGEALAWLQSAWKPQFESQRLSLLDEAHQQLKDWEQLKAVRWRQFENFQNYTSFERYLALLDEPEKTDAVEHAVENAQHGRDLIDSADLLCQLGRPSQAQALVLDRHHELTHEFYGQLKPLADKLEQEGCHLGACACYRALLTDILDRSYTKAYHYAADYYRLLDQLDSRIQKYPPLEDHRTFKQKLHQQHGRKRAFWSRLD